MLTKPTVECDTTHVIGKALGKMFEATYGQDTNWPRLTRFLGSLSSYPVTPLQASAVLTPEQIGGVLVDAGVYKTLDAAMSDIPEFLDTRINASCIVSYDWEPVEQKGEVLGYVLKKYVDDCGD